MAAAIRASQPKGDIVLLSSPNSSTSIGYYGRFKTLGTLYWENSQGLKNAADVYSAPSEAAAAALIKRFGITHLALLTEENFIAQYYLLRNPGSPVDDVRKGFGHQIFVERRLPAWLRVIPYKVPDDLAVLKQTVMLLAVDFNQSPADAIYHIAMGKVVDGAVADAEKDFTFLAEQVPASPQPWLRLSELAFLRQDGPAALRFAIEGANRLGVSERPAVVAEMAAKFYRAGSPQGAVILYRHGLSFGFNADLASSLAFVLATNKDDAIRNAREALSLAGEAVAAAPRSVVALSALAAAQAEAGNFAEAIAATERALANARLDGSEQGVRISMERLERFRAGKPLRE
jgi:tetratricopeptide (TPR) repeat protein